MEVLAPEALAGLTASDQRGGPDGSAMTGRLGPPGAVTVSSVKLRPWTACRELMRAVRGRAGWLEESRETVDGSRPCLRLTLDRTGEQGGKIALHPLAPDGGRRRRSMARLPWRRRVVLTAAFTDFAFVETCDTVEENTTDAGHPASERAPGNGRREGDRLYGGSGYCGRTWAEIDLDALAHNYRQACGGMIGPGVRYLGVVKADAYGHGAVQVARKLEELGADYLAVSSLDEARELRARRHRHAHPDPGPHPHGAWCRS